MDITWYETFFSDIALDFWRKVATPEQTRAEADFLERFLALAPGASLLDVPCGLGRHALELASRGFRLTGVDLSPEAIEKARERARTMGLSIEWRRSDMRDLPWQSAYDGAFCLGNSFGYFDTDGMRAFLQAVSRSLRPGTRFVVDTGMSAESILPRLKDREWMQVEEILFLEENRYHVREGCVETTYTFVRGGESRTRTGLHWVHTVREIRSMLAEAGLAVTELFSSLDGDPFQVGSPYLLVVTEKR